METKEIESKYKKAFFIGSGISVILNIILIVLIISTSNNYSDSKLLARELQSQLDRNTENINSGIGTAEEIGKLTDLAGKGNQDLGVTIKDSQEIIDQIGSTNKDIGKQLEDSIVSTGLIADYNRSIKDYNSKITGTVEESLGRVNGIIGDIEGTTGINRQGSENYQSIKNKKQNYYWWIGGGSCGIFLCWILFKRKRERVTREKAFKEISKVLTDSKETV